MFYRVPLTRKINGADSSLKLGFLSSLRSSIVNSRNGKIQASLTFAHIA